MTVRMASTRSLGGFCFKKIPAAPDWTSRRASKKAHYSGDHHNPSCKSNFARRFEESESTFFTQVQVQQNEIHLLRTQNG